ncbi:cyclic lactone autoinducer peptide [Lachnospiraceae bacterium PF1-21]|uniref:Cyclic lactone autoinducer peptide n=1 Tax=Ohessyouella blattaphilus TaxID=2949333 RepID=A0ABT1ELF3_9FIRM|nr:cyclic lactone autoinducer peptide [Ohessyouella blattaphilus]MCP1111515.1 cyclic lactone autoinducer peptide [Ohessyouella blattaphilus]MCR8564909.1 cyclic lactone autoinducer peptide [Ohessyouella blattaphilus]
MGKKSINKVLNVVNYVVEKVAESSAESACTLIYHQPPMPKSIKKYGKMKNEKDC